MTQDDVVLHFRTSHGFLSDFSNVAESTYDLLASHLGTINDAMRPTAVLIGRSIRSLCAALALSCLSSAAIGDL